MSAADFLERLQLGGIRVSRRGEELVVNGPANSLTPGIRAELTSRKAEVLTWLLKENEQPMATAGAIDIVDRNLELPLSFGQEQVWIVEQLAPGNGAYNIPLALTVRGELQVDVLRRAVAAMVDRHEIFRTTIAELDGVPFQRIDDGAPVELCVVPIAKSTTDEEFDDLIRAEVQRPFDLEAGPVLRTTLFERQPANVLLFTLHHSAGDGWSLGVLRREIFAFYDAFLENRTPEMDPLPIQYADFAAWQRAQWDAGVHTPALEYWREHLAGLPEALDLPTDHPAGARKNFHGSRVDIEISDVVYRQFVAVCREAGASFFMGALSAFQLLLYRFTGQSDLPVGTPIALRSRRETEGLIGNFTNPLVVRSSLAGSPSCRELIRRVRDTVFDAFDHADVPFEKLVEELHPGRDAGRNPLFQTFFVVHPPADSLDVRDLDVSPYVFDSGRSQLDLTLTLQEPATGESGVQGELSYDSELFDRATIARLARHIERVIEAIAADPDLGIDDVKLLDAEDEHQLLVKWNATSAPIPKFRGVHEWIEQNAADHPNSIAIVAPESHTALLSELTYRELNTRANLLAHRLQRIGVVAGDLVAICLERTPELHIALLAVWKAGGAYVPMDPGFPSERLEQMLGDSQATALITTSAIGQQLAVGQAVVCCLDERDQHGATNEEAENLGLEYPAGSLAYVIYTSGSTGRPKGVEIPHGAVLNFLASMARMPGMTAEDRLLAVTTFSFDIAVLELLLPLCVGGQVVLAASEDVYDGSRLISLIETHDVTVMQATPASWRLMLAAGWQGSRSLRALCGGEALPAELADTLGDRCGSLFNMYGPTETTIWSTIAKIDAGVRPVTIGRPIANTQAYILDTRGAPVPIGAVGELCIGGEGLACGYRGQSELTAERFIANPFADDAHGGNLDATRIYRTGDLARYQPDGEIECLGRLDSQIKLRGFRIELGEIESALEQYREINQAVVAAWGDSGQKRLVAYFESDSEIDPALLREQLRMQLPEYMVPSAYVRLDALPLTPNGKVDRNRLPEPDLEVALGQRDETGPRDETEEAIARIWCQFLELEKVGVHTPFFDVGGHSLLGLRVIAEINNRFSTTLAPVLFFEYPTIAGLAALVSGHGGSLSSRATTARTPSTSTIDIEGESLADVERVARVLSDRSNVGPSNPHRGRKRKPYSMRRSSIAQRFLAPLFRIQRGSLRRLLKFLILKLEGGGMYSLTMRDLWRRHFDIDVGDFANGGFNPVAIKPGTKIGRYSIITETARIETANHPANTFSSHGVFYREGLGFSPGFEIPRNRIEIGHDVFIGHNATILFPAQKIGDGAIIAAHAVVTSDVPPFAIVAGYPAVVVRYRFSEDKIKELLRLRWWDASLEELESVRDEFIRPLEGKQVR
jgi:amino acid adenylation domain-containing protein